MDITIVDGDGWEGLYIDGEIVTQGHHITKTELLDALGIKHKYIFVDEEWLTERGHLPQKLKQVKKYRE